MSLDVPWENILKRKSDEQLKPPSEDEAGRQETTQAALLVSETRLHRSRCQGGYVEKKIRLRIATFCCQCDDICAIKGDEDGGRCTRCDHHRCGECLLGRP